MDIRENNFHFLMLSRAFRSVSLSFASVASPLVLYYSGLSPIIVGVVLAITLVFTAVLSVTLGILGDYRGYRKALFASDFVSGLGCLLIGTSNSWLVVSLGVVLAGLSGGAGAPRGAFSPGTTALVSVNWREERERVARLGLLISVASVSSILGNTLFTLVSSLGNELTLLRYAYLFSSALLFLSAALVLKVEERGKAAKKEKVITRSSASYLLRVVASNAVNGFGTGLSVPILPLWLKLVGHLTDEEIGIVFTISSFLSAFGSLVAPKVKGDPVVIGGLSRSLGGVLLVLAAVFPSLSPIFVALRGLVIGVGAPNRSTANIRGYREEDYGTASSLQGIATRLSQTSTTLSGYLMEVAPELPLGIGGSLQVLAGVMYVALLRKRDT